MLRYSWFESGLTEEEKAFIDHLRAAFLSEETVTFLGRRYRVTTVQNVLEVAKSRVEIELSPLGVVHI